VLKLADFGVLWQVLKRSRPESAFEPAKQGKSAFEGTAKPCQSTPKHCQSTPKHCQNPATSCVADCVAEASDSAHFETPLTFVIDRCRTALVVHRFMSFHLKGNLVNHADRANRENSDRLPAVPWETAAVAAASNNASADIMSSAWRFVNTILMKTIVQ
jgi:hypothetical protein